MVKKSAKIAPNKSTYLPGIFRTRTRANERTNNPKPTKQEWEKMEVVKRFKLSGAAFYVGDE
ncbi:hypothetical protein PHLCEN_2v2388 [Hermanssonia centrifuga]|uniref:Uncharacterized protein n=1 Tax=Hermanssonia centrifuga TaxID=98765 RepID=A0A2R6RM06_9APHY|nr:hypothetical protein PHLCEN_2v2388 [Hermanssonia centrifuga]